MPNYMRTLLFTVISLTTIFVSCTNTASDKSELSSTKPEFLKHYTTATLPLKIKGCSSDGTPLLNPESLNRDMEDGSLPYCTFKTNGNYYAVIRLGMADCTLPSLITYDNNGHIIDEKFIAIGYCGSGPGFHCEEFAIIDKDFSIYTSDTISEMDIDSLGNEIESTLRKYIIYKKGRMLESGKIELTDTLSQLLAK